MKTFHNIMVAIVSMVFIVGLCSQAEAKKQAEPSSGKISAQELKQHALIKTISASRLDITPSNIVELGGTLSFRGTIVYSADLIDKINDYLDDAGESEYHIEPGSAIAVITALAVEGSTLEWWVSEEVRTTYPSPRKPVTIHFTEKYVVPPSLKPGQDLKFMFVLFFEGMPAFLYATRAGYILAERSVEVKGLSPEKPGGVPPRRLQQKGR